MATTCSGIADEGIVLEEGAYSATRKKIHTQLMNAIRREDWEDLVEIVNFLMRQKDDITINMIDENGHTALFLACVLMSEEDIIWFIELLDKSQPLRVIYALPVDPDVLCEIAGTQLTALHVLTIRGMAQAVLELGCCLKPMANILDSSGLPALHYALMAENIDLTEALLRISAHPARVEELPDFPDSTQQGPTFRAAAQRMYDAYCPRTWMVTERRLLQQAAEAADKKSSSLSTEEEPSTNADTGEEEGSTAAEKGKIDEPPGRDAASVSTATVPETPGANSIAAAALSMAFPTVVPGLAVEGRGAEAIQRVPTEVCPSAGGDTVPWTARQTDAGGSSTGASAGRDALEPTGICASSSYAASAVVSTPPKNAESGQKADTHCAALDRMPLGAQDIAALTATTSTPARSATNLAGVLTANPTSASASATAVQPSADKRASNLLPLTNVAFDLRVAAAAQSKVQHITQDVSRGCRSPTRSPNRRISGQGSMGNTTCAASAATDYDSDTSTGSRSSNRTSSGAAKKKTLK